MHLRIRLAAQGVELDRRQAMLLEVQAVRVRRVAGQDPEVELGDHAAAPAADLPAAHLQAVLVHALGDAVGRHHFLRRRVERAGAQVVREARLGFAHHDAHALARKRERAHQAGGTGSGDHNRKHR